MSARLLHEGDKDEPERTTKVDWGVKRVIEKVKLRRQSIHHRGTMKKWMEVGNIELAWKGIGRGYIIFTGTGRAEHNIIHRLALGTIWWSLETVCCYPHLFCPLFGGCHSHSLPHFLPDPSRVSTMTNCWPEKRNSSPLTTWRLFLPAFFKRDLPDFFGGVRNSCR